MKKHKVAIIHDVFIEWGGAERVVLEMLKIFPEADIYVPLITKKANSYLLKNGAKKVITSLFNYIPFVHSASILLKPFLFLYWERLDLSSYDLVISSSHSFSSKAVKTSSSTPHISYIHTSPRYLYDEYNETRILKKPFFKIIFTPLLSWLRKKDFLAAQRPSQLIANSEEVKKRIKKYYKRDSVVIYPPIKIPLKTSLFKLKKDYYVCFSRLAKQKGIDLAVKVCTEMKVSLKIIGEGSEEKYLKSLAGDTIEFLGRVSDKKLNKILSEAKALIYPSIEEDFGMAAVEVMAHGTPVIAYYSGGPKETIVSEKTGLFFHKWSEKSLTRSINKFEQMSFSSMDCRNQAKKFSKTVFRKNIINLVNDFRQ